MKAKPGDTIIITNPELEYFGQECVVIPNPYQLKNMKPSEYIWVTTSKVKGFFNTVWLRHNSYEIKCTNSDYEGMGEMEVLDAKGWEQKMRQKKHDAMAKMLGF